MFSQGAYAYCLEVGHPPYIILQNKINGRGKEHLDCHSKSPRACMARVSASEFASLLRVRLGHID